jgi:3-oxoacyl-[acyl-carrier protein] reductase
VVINYTRSVAEAEATRAEAEQLGVAAIAVRADVAEDADCRALVAAAQEAFGRLDVLVNNAGTTSFINHRDLESVTADAWQRIMAVNVMGPFQCARAAKPLLEADGGGTIVNVSSIAGISAVGSSIPYCASKAALNNLTVALARSFGPHIRVNAVAPGFITGRWLQNGLGADAYEAAKQHYERRTPLQRVCSPKDVADAIMSLITGSDLVTGQVLPVEGGMLIAAV